MSLIISFEVFSIRTLANAIIAGLISLNFGTGRPLQRLARVQETLRQNDVPGGVAIINCEIGSTANLAIIVFLMFTLSPARLPSAQTACSTTSRLLLPSSLIKASIVPWSSRHYAYLCSPQAMLVIHHAASNYIWRKSSLPSRKISLGTKLLSITRYRGALSSIVNNFLIPHVPTNLCMLSSDSIKSLSRLKSWS